MVLGQLPNAQKSPYRPTSREKSFPRGTRCSIFGDPRALIGPRCACLRPARASLSLGKLSPYHTMRGCSLDPRAEPMSRHHDRCAPHDTGVPRWSDVGCVFGKFECRAWTIGPINLGIHMYIQFRYEIHPRTRDHSHMCDQKCMHRRLARQTTTHKARRKHTAGATARERFARARPTPGPIARAPRALHGGMRDVLGLEDAPGSNGLRQSGMRSASSRRAKVQGLCKGGRISPALH